MIERNDFLLLQLFPHIHSDARRFSTPKNYSTHLFNLTEHSGSTHFANILTHRFSFYVLIVPREEHLNSNEKKLSNFKEQKCCF